MPFTNQPPGFQISSAGKPLYINPYPPFNTNQFVIKGGTAAPIFGSNAFGSSIRGRQGSLQTNQPKTAF